MQWGWGVDMCSPSTYPRVPRYLLVYYHQGMQCKLPRYIACTLPQHQQPRHMQHGTTRSTATTNTTNNINTNKRNITNKTHNDRPGGWPRGTTAQHEEVAVPGGRRGEVEVVDGVLGPSGRDGRCGEACKKMPSDCRVVLEPHAVVLTRRALKEWMTSSLPYLKLHSWSTADAQHPRVVFSYTVPSINANRMGNMHGGCTATLFDFCTSLPLTLVNKPGFWFWLGVSRTLNVTYLKPIPVGERILIECELMSIGKTLSTIRGVMRRQSDGVALATCEHGKFNTDPDVQPQSQKKSKL